MKGDEVERVSMVAADFFILCSPSNRLQRGSIADSGEEGVFKERQHRHTGADVQVISKVDRKRYADTAGVSEFFPSVCSSGGSIASCRPLGLASGFRVALHTQSDHCQCNRGPLAEDAGFEEKISLW